jgi:cell division protein FtsB
MRIKRSVTRIFTVLIVPAISLAVVGYFGTYAIWGNRGVLALEDTQAQLGVQQQQLAELQTNRQRLEHRIALMEKNGGDPDLVEELARTQLMDGATNQVAVPRSKN